MDMHRLVEQKFEDAYPLLMSQDRGATFSHFGLEVGPGWYPLVYELFGLFDDLQCCSGKAVRINQVKDKFGTLTVYADLPSQDIEQDILESVFMLVSARTCDLCGRPGKLGRREGWIAARCKAHRAIRHPAAKSLCEQTAKDFLTYERQGVITAGVVYAKASKSDKGDDFADLSLYELPGRIDHLRGGLLDKLVVRTFAGSAVSELRNCIEGLEASGKKILGVTDVSRAANRVMGREVEL